MTSPSMLYKIAKAKESARLELPKARLCGKVICASLNGGEPLQEAVFKLKQEVGNNWSQTLAFQFMSGMRGEFAANCAQSDEKEELLFACRLARLVCEHVGLEIVLSLNNKNLEVLNALANALKTGETSQT